MPVIEIVVKDGGEMEMDFKGFEGNSCKIAEDDLRNRLRSLRLEVLEEKPKDDELLQEENEEMTL